MRFLLSRSLFLSRKPVGEKQKQTALCVSSRRSLFPSFMNHFSEDKYDANSLSKFCDCTPLRNFKIHYPCSIFVALTFRFCFVSRGEKVWHLWSTDKLHLTIDIIIDLSSIMQQPELLPAHHPAGFSICELMAERHRAAHCKLFLLRKKPHVKIKAATREIYYVTKCGWLPNVSSNFSKKETSQVSPGLRHSSFCNY